jgi:hypothetical protein
MKSPLVCRFEPSFYLGQIRCFCCAMISRYANTCSRPATKRHLILDPLVDDRFDRA